MRWRKGKPASGSSDLTAFIDEGSEIEGKYTFHGTVMLNGKFSGEIQTVDAIIMGSYQGNMIATGNVEITDTGRVTGNITTDSLVISKGGFFNGNVTKMNELPNGQRPVYLMDDFKTAQLSGQR